MNLIIILSTFRYLKYGFAGLTLFLLVTGLVATIATARGKDPSPSEYAEKAILELDIAIVAKGQLRAAHVAAGRIAAVQHPPPTAAQTAPGTPDASKKEESKNSH